jgi:flavin reductase
MKHGLPPTFRMCFADAARLLHLIFRYRTPQFGICYRPAEGRTLGRHHRPVSLGKATHMTSVPTPPTTPEFATPEFATPESVTPEAYAAAMNLAATPVTIVSTTGPAGTGAQTVSAMCTVSSDPPMLLVSLSTRSPVSAMILGNGHFRVNLLGSSHDHVSDTFAGRPWAGKVPYDFTCGDWAVDDPDGPRLTDAVASLRCELSQTVEVGTHNVFFGAVTELDTNTELQPLVYLKRIYRRLEELPLSTFEAYPDAKPPYERTRDTP